MLDTWFSSLALADLDARLAEREVAPTSRAFYPTDVLVTAPEILFFWVARMIMSGYEFMGDAPFHTRVPARHRARHAGPQDVQVARQRHRSARRRASSTAPTRCARRSSPGMGLGADVILDPDRPREVVRDGPQLRDEALEHRPLPARQRRRRPGAPDSTSSTARPLARADAWILDRLDVAIRECDRAHRPASQPARGAWRAGGAAARDCAQRVRRDGAPLRVERARRLVSRGDQDAARSRRATTSRSRARCSCTCSTRRCACCTRSCRS